MDRLCIIKNILLFWICCSIAYSTGAFIVAVKENSQSTDDDSHTIPPRILIVASLLAIALDTAKLAAILKAWPLAIQSVAGIQAALTLFVVLAYGLASFIIGITVASIIHIALLLVLANDLEEQQQQQPNADSCGDCCAA